MGHAGVNRMELAVRQAHAEAQLSKLRELPIILRQLIRWFKRHRLECKTKWRLRRLRRKGL